MRVFKVLVSCVVMGAVAAPLLAQNDEQPPAGEGRPGGRGAGGPGGQGGGPRQAPLSPEKAKAAWELEAKSVAASLGLSEDKSAEVTKAYVDARTSLGAAVEKVRDENRQKMQDGEEPDRGAMREQMESLNSSERAKLEKALSATLLADQTKAAMATLGTFNRGWDQMVNTIAGFKLEAGKQTSSLMAVHDFVVVQGAARAQGPDADREAMRTANQAAREKLNTTLKGILSDEQFKQFESATGRGPRGPRGGGEDGAPPRGGRGGGGKDNGGKS